MSILKTEQVKKVYQSDSIAVHALQGVDVSIERGEFVAIVGPSGSGKSTLLNIIGGLDAPSSGKVFLEDVDLSTLNQNHLAELRLHKIGFIFQAYNLIPVLTVEENVEFIMMLQHVPKSERSRKVKHLLEEIGIGDYLDRRPDRLSGGQQQRVAVARAIVSEPLLILADEPTANLDSQSGAVLLDLMESLNRKKNITFIFSTHDPQVMERARRLIVLKDGRIIEDRIQST
jgi:putative ABC transport system ATP-binding protein